MSPKRKHPVGKPAAGGPPKGQTQAASAFSAGPFVLRWTEAAAGQFKEIQNDPADPGLAKQVAKALRLLAANPRHNSLQTHAFQSLTGPNGEKVFEAYAQNKTSGAYRIFFCYGPSAAVITVIAITEHP